MSLSPWIETRVPKSSRRERTGSFRRAHLARLFRLVLILESERYPNARVLAERCEVSRRTIYRDLELLAESGVPVRYRQERQGYHLAKGFFLPPTNLAEIEALALLVLGRQGCGGEGLGLLRHAWAGALKLVQGLSPEVRERVLAAAEPFRVDPPPEAPPEDRQMVYDGILAALNQSRQLRLWYRSGETTVEECTKFALYRLLLHGHHWFLIGRSTLHRRVEVIGVHWVRKVVLTEDRYVIPPRFNLERFLGQAWGVMRGASRHDVRLRFSPRVASEVIDTSPRHGQRRVELPDGRVELHLVVDGLDEVLRWLLGFGDQVEVIAPPRLRERLYEVALNMARMHQPAPRVTACS